MTNTLQRFVAPPVRAVALALLIAGSPARPLAGQWVEPAGVVTVPPSPPGTLAARAEAVRSAGHVDASRGVSITKHMLVGAVIGAAIAGIYVVVEREQEANEVGEALIDIVTPALVLSGAAVGAVVGGVVGIIRNR